jgi:hypothetical protein
MSILVEISVITVSPAIQIISIIAIVTAITSIVIIACIACIAASVGLIIAVPLVHIPGITVRICLSITCSLIICSPPSIV